MCPQGERTYILGTPKGDLNPAGAKIWLPVVSQDFPLCAYPSPEFLKEFG
jgi:hypothetical protein